MRWKVEHPFRDIPYELGDMTSADGKSMWWELDPLATKFTLRLADEIAKTPAYQLLAELLPSDKVPLYFEASLRFRLRPVMRALLAAQWYAKNVAPGKCHEVVWSDHRGLGPYLQTIWPSTTIPLKLGNSRGRYINAKTLLGRLRRSTLRRVLRLRRRLSSRDGRAEFPKTTGPAVTTHYIEGIDPTRRSDILWFDPNVIEPGRVLVYFDYDRAAYRGRLIPDSVVKEIEDKGMKWVCLKEGTVERSGAPVWEPDHRDHALLSEFRRRKPKPGGPMERRVTAMAEQLLEQVDYWKAFHDYFDVKVHMETVEGCRNRVEQSIALDIAGRVRMSCQRSEAWLKEGGELGDHPNHAYFVWNKRAAIDAVKNRNRNDSVIVSGFTYDKSFQASMEPDDLRAQVIGNGAKFVLALFDNIFLRDEWFSKAMMQSLYTVFLRWVIEDPEVGVITKSKKPGILEGLPEIRGLMAEAEATGRWVNLSDIFGRLPSDASRASDMSIGIGISSAVVEAVSAGGKGIHWDPTLQRAHPFYDWGYEKTVFNDLDQMISALKRYKADPGSDPELGDFSNHMEEVDPFHDRRAGERVGAYIGSLLEAFDRGADRAGALRFADEEFRSAWGADKVQSPKSPAGLTIPSSTASPI